jgi:short-subunit dehydrogenase involved in D-alanine esterification of teichoic acids
LIISGITGIGFALVREVDNRENKAIICGRKIEKLAAAKNKLLINY